MSDDDYKRDPETGKFKPGNKGGPGRPKGSTGPSLKAALVRAIENSPEKDGKTILDGLATVWLRQALAGDVRFLAMILDRLDGPVKQEIVQDTTVFIERVSSRTQRLDPEEPDK